MRDGGRGSSDEALEWVEGEGPDNSIPFDVPAFWERLCRLIKERSSGHDTDKLCVKWLSENVASISQKTFSRWSKGETCPQWGKIDDVVAALNMADQAKISMLTRKDLVRGLPLAEATAPQPAAGTSPAPAAADLDGLLAKVREALRKAPTLAAALADKGYGRADVAGALVNRPAKRVAMDLAELVRAHGDAAREVLWYILPLIGDWEDLLRQARAAGGTCGNLELRLCTETVAEIIVARAEARACLYAPGGVVPQGAAHVPMPAAAHAPFFNHGGALLVEAVLINLWEECDSERSSLPDRLFWQGIKSRFRRKEAFAKVAAVEIKTSAQLGRGRYLLVIDETLDPDGIKDMDASWSVAQQALGAALPGLRLVRLKGRVEQMTDQDEYELATFIREVRDRA